MKCLLIHEVKGTDSKIIHKRMCFRVAFLVRDNSVVAVTPEIKGKIKRFHIFPFSCKSSINVYNVSRIIFLSRLFLKMLLILQGIGGSGSLLATSPSAN